MLVTIENKLINEINGLLTCIKLHENNGSFVDGSQPQAGHLYETLMDMKRIPIGNNLTLLEAYREKRKYDGLNGRCWNACKHLDAEELIKRLEDEE